METFFTPENQTEKETEKKYLYHMVPEDMQGAILHPLNSLKEVYPELYISKAGKYENRKYIMEQFIPTLQCVWNDVLHFSAINPIELKQALIEAGMNPEEMKFYQIDPKLLDPKQTTIYLYQERTIEADTDLENFSEYNTEKLIEHSVLSQITKDYYKERISKGEKPLLFVGIPHILHKGSLDISNLPIITV